MAHTNDKITCKECFTSIPTESFTVTDAGDFVRVSGKCPHCKKHMTALLSKDEFFTLEPE